MNFENYSTGFIDNTTDITGVLMFLAVAYGNYGNDREHEAPYYKRKDRSYGNTKHTMGIQDIVSDA